MAQRKNISVNSNVCSHQKGYWQTSVPNFFSCQASPMDFLLCRFSSNSDLGLAGVKIISTRKKLPSSCAWRMWHFIFMHRKKSFCLWNVFMWIQNLTLLPGPHFVQIVCHISRSVTPDNVATSSLFTLWNSDTCTSLHKASFSCIIPIKISRTYAFSFWMHMCKMF